MTYAEAASPEILAFNPGLIEVEGAPRLSSLDPEKSDLATFKISNSYNNNIASMDEIHRGEDTVLVLDDPESYINLITIDEQFSHLSVGAIRAILHDDPTSIIPTWKTNNPKGPYLWNILSQEFENLPDDQRAPFKIIVVGYPESKADFMCEWGGGWSGLLLGIYPTQVAGIWCGKRLYKDEPFIVLNSRKNHSVLAVFDGGKCIYYNTFRDMDVALHDLTPHLLEIRQDRKNITDETPVLTFGTNDKLRRDLGQTYKNIPRFSPSLLQQAYGFSYEDQTITPEAWLLIEVLFRQNPKNAQSNPLKLSGLIKSRNQSLNFLIPSLYLKRIGYISNPIYRHTFTVIVASILIVLCLSFYSFQSFKLLRDSKSKLQVANENAIQARSKIASMEGTRKMFDQIISWNDITGLKIAPVLSAIEETITKDASVTELNIPTLDYHSPINDRNAQITLTLFWPRDLASSAELTPKDNDWTKDFARKMDEYGYISHLETVTDPDQQLHGYTRIFTFKFKKKNE